jgi:glycosyltransferase involved in cell wall biosynthesis
MAKRHEITLLAYAAPDADHHACQRITEAGVRLVSVRPVRREQRGAVFFGKLLVNLFSALPYVAWNHCSLRMQRTLDQLLRAHSFDAVHCEMTLMSPLLRTIRHVPTVSVAHNVETEIWRRYEHNELSAFRRRYIGLQRRRVEQLESRGLDHVTTLCTVSERDAAWYRQHTGVRNIHVVPNGVDLEYFQPGLEPEEPQTLVHAGAMDWRPNIDAMTFFLEAIYPSMVAASPDLRLLIVGRNPSNAFIRMAEQHRGVKVTGSVEDARPLIRRGAVFVVPLRIGGGSRLKILNALAMGKAIVSTSVGAEGLDVRDGEHLLIADTPELFVARTLELLGAPAKRQRLGTAGRALVEARYGWDAIADRLDAAWHDTVSRFGRPA